MESIYFSEAEMDSALRALNWSLIIVEMSPYIVG